MKNFTNSGYWALILGGSSGIGLASAKKLAAEGMNICVIHRDRRGAMAEIEKGFEEIRQSGVSFISLNVNALVDEKRVAVIEELKAKLKDEGKVRVLLHSIARGNLKPLIQAERLIRSDV